MAAAEVPVAPQFSFNPFITGCVFEVPRSQPSVVQSRQWRAGQKAQTPQLFREPAIDYYYVTMHGKDMHSQGSRITERLCSVAGDERVNPLLLCQKDADTCRTFTSARTFYTVLNSIQLETTVWCIHATAAYAVSWLP
jgi:hypothetical protein